MEGFLYLSDHISVFFYSCLLIMFQCNQCSHKAKKNGNLTTHIKSIHEGVKFPCAQCNYKATQEGNLLTHIKSIHEGVKFSCDQCDYKASSKGLLCDQYRHILNQFMKVLSFPVINIITRQHGKELY